MSRRALLVTAGAALVAGCERGRRAPAGGPAAAGAGEARGDLLVVDTADGIAVLSAAGAAGPAEVPPTGGLLAPGGDHLIGARVRLGRTELVDHDLQSGGIRWRATVPGDLRPCAASATGRLVALVGGDRGAGSVFRPAGRSRTTVVVADDGGERVRLDLPGNLEPEAFSADGGSLFVLDYRPPTAPDRYRVRALDLASGRLEPLLTRVKSPVPPGAEEEMRGEGRQAVYDAARGLLFTLYTHQPDHRHTRDLVAGARPGAGHVHAFVHTLSLREHWAFCVDLPAPFGARPAIRHAIAMSPAGGSGALTVVEASTGVLARIDPDGLNVVSTERFTPPAEGASGAVARFTARGDLAVANGPDVARIGPGGSYVAHWTCGSDVRGLAPHPDGRRVFVGQDGAVACHDATTGRRLYRIPVPGLTALRELIPVA